MRELVPTGSEFTTLIDSISSRAVRRGVRILSIDPQTAQFDASFQVERYQYMAIGHYHAIGAFLADIASLRRVMVPYDISLNVASAEELQGLLTEPGYQYLRVQFMIRTFVKGEAGMESEFGVPVP
jgi:type IV pilus assembly protein PilO